MILILIAIYLLILFIEMPRLIKNKWQKEIFVFLAFYIISLYMGLAYYYHGPLMAPFEMLTGFAERFLTV